MVELLDTEYLSKSDTFLLPLTGLKANPEYPMASYLFWNEFSIEDYKLIVTFEYGDNYGEFIVYARNHMFPILDKEGYLIESYDLDGRSVFILDMSKWAMDIEQFLSAKYSKMTREAKALIQSYHTYGNNNIGANIWGMMYPNEPQDILGQKTPIEYMAENYGFELSDLQKIGEIGSVYDKQFETLVTNIDEICQFDT